MKKGISLGTFLALIQDLIAHKYFFVLLIAKNYQFHQVFLSECIMFYEDANLAEHLKDGIYLAYFNPLAKWVVHKKMDL